MARKMAEWPSNRGPLTKIRPSEGCKGDAVLLVVGKWYKFHGLGIIGEDVFMRARAIMVLLSALTITACQTPPDKYTWLKQIDLKPVAKAGFHDYKKLSYPAYFAVTEDGRVYGYSFCGASGCQGNAIMVAIYSCERSSKGAPCKIYAKRASPVFRP